MKRPSFLHGVCAAAVLAFSASVALAVLAPILSSAALFKLLIPALGLAYITYLLSQSSERVGRVTSLTLWLVLAVVTWIFEPPLTLYVLIHVGALWLMRSLYFYSTITPALMDLCLNVFSMAAALWALAHTGSTFLAVWCFFLAQALFIAIPPTLNRQHPRESAMTPDSGNFERARSRADTALRQLIAR